jgi:hypothetical protein
MKNLCGKGLLLTLFLMPMISCSSSDKKVSEKSSQQQTTAFKVPEIPSVLRTPDQKMDYMMEHYWDHFNFRDSMSLQRPMVAEQAFVDFIHVLFSVPPQKAEHGMTVLMSRAGVSFKMLKFFLDLGEKYLYDPNSPARNEGFYCIMLEHYLSSKLVDADWKIRPQEQYNLAQKNKVGSLATDFRFWLKDGSVSSLYKVKSRFLLLYFHNPGCTDCMIERKKVIASPVMQKLQENGVLKVLSIYPDEDLAEWTKHYSDLPTNWVNGYDKSVRIKKDDIYDLKAIPSFYLLDEQKNVLLKDARFEEIEAYLSKI